MRHSVQRSWSILRLGIIGPSIGHLTARCWRLWRITPENKGAELAQKPTVVALGNGPSPTAQFGIDRLFHEFFYDAPAHIDVATILDELAFEDPPVKLSVEIEHLLCRFVDDLLREQVFDRRREVVDFEPLTPTAIDVIEHPLEGPEPAEQPVSRVVTQPMV